VREKLNDPRSGGVALGTVAMGYRLASSSTACARWLRTMSEIEWSRPETMVVGICWLIIGEASSATTLRAPKAMAWRIGTWALIPPST
jgi:hypothetical protein